ncbi:MAG: hemolysin family protein [Lachnospiraceae bacterium]|nr:hemolysin family protein [Lachnospiraceae bacterium]
MDDSPRQGFSEKLRKFIKNRDMNDEEMLAVVDEFKNQGVIEEDEAEMISNVIDFSDTNVGDIMTHRSKIDFIEKGETVESALKLMLKENHTRFPVFGESIDKVEGVLYVRDLMKAYMDGKKDMPVMRFAREPLFVPDTMLLDTLFETLREKRTHFAIVIDEYGQTAGVVSMEDLIEEIVGDIYDEYDQEDDEVTLTGDGEYRLSPEIRLDELAEELPETVLSEEELDDFDTLNGLLVSKLGHIPDKGERAEVSCAGYLFRIYSETGRVITDITAVKVTEEPLGD